VSLLGAPVWPQNAQPPKYSADVPPWITTPNTVETRIGTLRFNDGAPDENTVKTVYDQIDFSRGIEAFLTGMSATSVYAACDGFNQVGIKTNQGMGITADLMDARSLFLTANTTTVYVFFCIDLKDGPMVVQVPAVVLGPADDGEQALQRGRAVRGGSGMRVGLFSLLRADILQVPVHARDEDKRCAGLVVATTSRLG
jgi:hypothetical protein